MKRAGKWKGSLTDFLKGYRYQLELTVKLDRIGPQRFSQNVINEIVLWKVNRYAELSPVVSRQVVEIRAQLS